MCDVQFKYLKKYEIPNELRLLTESLLGYSFIDDSPIYNIQLNVDKEIVNDLLFDSYNKNNHIEGIKLFIRKEKTKKILGKSNDKDIEKFTTFLQYYIDNINHMIVMQPPVSTA